MAANQTSFKKGDPRINRKGRPKDFDGLRELAKLIAHERVGDFNGHGITAAELILRQWAKSGNPQLQRAFIEVAFGKVPDNLELSTKDGKEIVFRVIYDKGRVSNPPTGAAQEAGTIHQQPGEAQDNSGG